MAAVERIHEMLARLETLLRTRNSPHVAKELVFNRVRVLRNEGYADDVALSKAMREHNFSA